MSLVLLHSATGTSLGGGTFWGLTRLLTNVTSFDEIREMNGDNTAVDLMVGDIYGGSYKNVGLASNVIASNFGKVGHQDLETNIDPKTAYRGEDIVKSLLVMVCNNIGLSLVLTTRSNCLPQRPAAPSQPHLLHGKLPWPKRVCLVPAAVTPGSVFPMQ